MKFSRIIILLLFIFVLFSIFSQKKFTEGFQSSQFDSCRSKGYSKEFCLQTPSSAYGPSSCLCEDGKLGRFIPGFGGKCLCF
jgi:hypothetical protein|uniref:Uncharacterized protein n=1 Tax=viral metagenome TaxID=1070528 RepID=A0A6C0CKB4_9ZZZZ